MVGDVFKGKPDVVRGRLARELRNSIADYLTVPVAGRDEIRQRLQVGPRDIARLVVFLGIVLLIYVLIFTNQETVLRFVARGESVPHRMLAALALLVGIPSFAYLYGSGVNVVTKLLRFD